MVFQSDSGALCICISKDDNVCCSASGPMSGFGTQPSQQVCSNTSLLFSLKSVHVAEHLFLHIFAIYTSLLRCLLNSFSHFSIGLFFCFLLLNFKSLLYILGVNSLYVCFAVISTHYVACLFTLLRVSLNRTKVFSFNKV